MAQGTNIGSLFYTLGIDTTGLQKDSKKAQGVLSGLFSPAMLGTAALGGALLKLGGDALAFSRDFETAFAEVQTISESARMNADSMRESILKMTEEIPVGAVDSTRALYQIVSAGFDGAEAMNVLEISAKAAVAGVSTTAIAADTLTTIINAYGMTAGDAMKVSDALFKTVELGKTTLSEIGSSFSQVASIAASYNIQVNDVLAGLASITKQGASTGEAITRLRGAIVSLAKEFGPAVFEGRSLGEAFQFARDEADKSGKTYEEFFGRVEASTGILQLTGNNAIVFAESLDKINASAGSTEGALDVMNGTLEKQEQLFKNKLNVILSEFGDILVDIEKSVLPGLNAELEVLTNKDIPALAKVASVLANTLSLGFGRFGAEDFVSETRKFLLDAEREVVKFNEKSKKLSDEEFQAEVDRINRERNINIKSFENLQDRKEKGFQFDKEALKEAERRNVIFYSILEAAEERLAKIREKSPSAGGGKKEDPEVIVPRIELKDLKEDLKKLQDLLDKSTEEEAIVVRAKIAVKEEEILNFGKLAETDPLKEIEIKPNTIKSVKTYKNGLADMSKEIDRATKRATKFKKEANEATDADKLEASINGLLGISDVMGELAGLASNFDDELARSLDTMAQMATGAANIVAGFSKGGDPIQGIIGGIQVLGSVLGGGQKDTKSFSEVMSEFVESLESARAALESLNGRKFNAELSYINTGFDNIIKQIELLAHMADNLGGVLGDAFGLHAFKFNIENINDLNDAITELSNKILSGELEEAAENYAKDILDTFVELKDQLEQITQDLTGTTADQLTDSLVDAFEQGEDAAEAWGDTVEDVIRNSIINQLKAQLLIKPIQAALDQLTRDIADEGLQPEEATNFIDTLNALQSEYASAFTELNEVFKQAGIDLSDAESTAADGIAGAIGRALTEDTATEWIGIQNRVLFETIEHTSILNESNNYLSEIAINTKDTADELRILNEKISSDSTGRDTGNII